MMRRVQFSEEQDRALTHAWKRGESMDVVSARMKISRSILYRRARSLGLGLRQPQKRPKTFNKTLPWVPKHAHPLVRSLFTIMRRQKVPISSVARAAGVTREAIGGWRLHSSPLLVNFVATLNSLGYELVIQPTKEKAAADGP
jgi:hypothetical protein